MAREKRERSWVFYYDGDCGFCTLAVRSLAFADFFGKVTWTAFQELTIPPQGLTWEELDAAAYLETGSRAETRTATPTNAVKRYRGFYAFRMLTLRLPPLFPLALFLWLPGFDRLGVAAYQWVAANRYRISRRCRLKADR